ncbi:hypothetical protein GQ457_02G026650 [Hibiscus cannabinus]
MNRDGQSKAEFVKKLHQQVKENLDKRTQQYEKRANKAQRSFQLLPRGDGPFQIVEKVNDNVYKLDLSGEYTVSATFNISDLTPFHDSAYLRSNPFQGGGDDVSTSVPAPIVDPEVLPQGPITRSKAKQFREALSLICAKLPNPFVIDRSSDEPEGQTPSLQVGAIIRELKKSFREELEPIHDRLERLEGSQTNATEEDHAENGSDQTPNQRQNPRQGRVQQVDDNLTNIKIVIPSFQGRPDPNAYLAWESKVEHVFECYNYSEQKKVRLAAMEFIDYALLWWDQLLISRRRTGEGPGLKQGSRSVEDYFKEMEMSMMRANIVEDREATMARFLAGLNTEIANVVELQHYVELEDMVHVAIKIERQQRWKLGFDSLLELDDKGDVSTRDNGFGLGRFSRLIQISAERLAELLAYKSVHRGNTPSNVFPNSFSAPNDFRKPTPQAPLQIREEANSSKSKPPVADNGRGKQVAAQERSRDIQCFKCLGRGHLASQCPNRRIVLLKENGEIDFDSEKEEQEPSDEDVGDDIQLAEAGEVLVIKRSLNAQPMQDDQQRETIFHTRCLVSDKVVVPFSIGRYKDEVKCDVCPMDACHLLLGRPWQYDRRVLHDCFTNRYSFDHEGKKVILAPMSPREVYEDQIHLKASIAAWKASKEKITCENRESHTKVISASTSSSISSFNLQDESRAPSADSKEEEHELEDLSLARVKLRSLYAARFSSKKLAHLQLAHFSSLRLHSAQLQLY